MEQIQYCVKFPDAGLRLDRVRLDSVNLTDWQRLCQLTARYVADFPLLSDVLAHPLNLEIPRCDLLRIQAELANFLVVSADVSGAVQDVLTFSLFVDQVLQQETAVLTVEHWPGRRFEGQVFVFPGTDLLARLQQLPANQPSVTRTSAPRTSAPRTSVPRTSVPRTSAPRTTAARAV